MLDVPARRRAPLVHNGRLYVYTGHDEDGSTYFTMRDWHVYSTTDMANWTDHGSPMSLATFSWARADAWAGHVTYRNGRFHVRQEAETSAQASGVETEPASGGGMNVGYVDNGDCLQVKGAGFGGGAASLTARVASGTSGGRIEIRLDGPAGALAGTCGVPGTGGRQNWTTVSCPVTGVSGTRDLYLRFAGGSGYLLNVDWWRFTAAGSRSKVR